jgi:hypothetical protein
MRKLYLEKMFGLTSALVLGAGLNAMASTVDLTFTWSGSLYQAGYSAQYINTSDAIGIYAFNVPPNNLGVPHPTLYSVCLSPLGLLDGNTHQYNVVPFNQSGINGVGSQGIYPSAWAQGSSGQQWGINNAAYLWSTYGNGIVAEQNSSKAAALEFAIWTALYDSTGFGGALNNIWVAPTLQMNATTLGYYNTYVAAITASAPHQATYAGNVLESTITDQGAGSGGSQEFFLLGTPVPEPTTMVAGALLLLPFGLCTLRMLRKSRTA